MASDEIDRRLGQPEGWTRTHFAIDERAVAGPEETSSRLAELAARSALDAAGWRPEELDLVVGACGVMEQPIPGTATLVQRRLGLGDSGVPAFDVNATCLSFLVALDLVALGLKAGRWNKVLVFSADIASAALDFDDPEASVIFGDGAAAVAMETGEDPDAWLGMRLETYGEGFELCRLEAGGTRLRPHDDLDGFLARSRFVMDGPGVFKATARRFPRFISKAFNSFGVTEADIDLIVPHQASAAAIAHLKRTLPSLADRVVEIFADHGNQIATSMPSALHHAIATGRLKRGDTALLLGTAAGVSLGAAAFRY